MKRLLFPALLLSPVFLCADPAQAAVVTLAFTGTYDTGSLWVAGLRGSDIPYRYEITYDTSLAPEPVVIPAGTVMGNVVYTEMRGYSRAGITAASLTFGNATWTPAGLQARTPAPGMTADLWFDTDLSAETPTSAWMLFAGVPAILELGGGAAGPGGVYLGSSSNVTVTTYTVRNGIVVATVAGGYSNDLTITAVPEPSAAVFLGLGALACGGRRRQRARGRHAVSL